MKQMLLEKSESSDFDLSIVIPIYNETTKFENTLTSYQAAFKDQQIRYEFVIVDNNSTQIQDIFAIIEKHREHVPITFILQPRLIHTFSLCSARNRGVLGSRGRYIFFTDSDCMVDPLFALTIKPIVLGGGASSHLFTGERVFVRVDRKPYTIHDISAVIPILPLVPSASNYGMVKDRRFPWIERLPHQEHPWNFVHGCFILLKKTDYIAVGGSDTAYDGNWGYEEIDLAYRMVKQLGTQIRYLSDAKVYHQEYDSDLEKIKTNSSRTDKSRNPNYILICDRIAGYDEFKRNQWQTLQVKVT